MVSTGKNEYVLLHGVATRKFEDLTFNMPSDFKKVYNSHVINCVQNDSMFCCMSDSGSSYSGLINCGKNDLSVIYVQSFLGQNNTPAKRRGRCLALPNNARANRLCRALSSTTNPWTTNTWTPSGADNKYNNYYLK